MLWTQSISALVFRSFRVAPTLCESARELACPGTNRFDRPQACGDHLSVASEQEIPQRQRAGIDARQPHRAHVVGDQRVRYVLHERP
jgi:hypothetical protein